MTMKRREFLKHTLVAVTGAALPLGVLEFVDPREVLADYEDLRWIFLVDTQKCVGCGFCVKACKLENHLPLEVQVSRTWVERYVITKDGTVHIDSPKAALHGFTTTRLYKGQGGYTTPRVDVEHGRIEKEEAGFVERGEWINVPGEQVAQAFFVPKLCNQCDNPPCVQVCPVGATYQTADGVVLVDRTWCIGCGYCIMGCPYGARFFHPEYKVAEKCTFCYHRLHNDLSTACVTACPFSARRVGNLKDRDDPVTQVVLQQRVGVLKDEYGTKPQVFYLGLNKEVR